MKRGYQAENFTDGYGMPAGGTVSGTGIMIVWQKGPLGRGKERIAPNGAFVEDVIAAVIERIDHFQTVCDGRFRCRENSIAILKLGEALVQLERRTREREARGVEGTHES